MDLNYLLRKPNTIDSNTELLIMLHGYGSNEEDLFSFVPALPEECIVLSFRAPHQVTERGFSWYDIDFNNPDNYINTEQAFASLNKVLKSIQEFRKENKLSGKINLMGFSQGGVLCYALALTFPMLFNKIAILSAYPEMKILNKISSDKKALSGLDFFISHGMEDVVIPLEWARNSAELLDERNIKFTFREYMSGHNINQKNCLDLIDFFENKMV